MLRGMPGPIRRSTPYDVYDLNCLQDATLRTVGLELLAFVATAA